MKEVRTDVKAPIICGIQQIGVGVSNVAQAYTWYKEFLGCDVVIFDEKAPAEYMLPYTEGKPRQRHAILAMNLQGGGGFEIWQHTGFEPREPDFEVLPGDYGVFVCKVKCKKAIDAHKYHIEKNGMVSMLYKDALGRDYYYLTDPFGNKFQVIEIKKEGSWFSSEDKFTGGVYGAIVGTNDIEASIVFYREVLGYDKIYKDETATFSDFSQMGAQSVNFRRVLIGHSQPRKGAFSQLLGESEIELIQAIDRTTPCRKIFENRMWGELGFIQICYDVRNIDSLREKVEKLGFPFTVDSIKQNSNFDMGDAAGHFAYNEDPSGSLIEYVETRKIPLLKKLGIYLNVGKWKAEKALPAFIIKGLRFMRKKEIKE